MKALWLAPLLLAASPAAPLPSLSGAGSDDTAQSVFDGIVSGARTALERRDLGRARDEIQRALERDAKNRAVWALRTQWAEAAEDRDELVYSLHNELRLAIAQGAPRDERVELRTQLLLADPLAEDVLDMRQRFVEKLLPIAERYESEERPHSAIRVHRQILALDPERTASEDAVQRLASAPDPSLAEDAKATDLLAGVSDEWIRKHDAKHFEWKDKAQVKRDNYVTKTDAGYAVLIRASEAMEQMNAFYRQFFRHGTKEHGGSVPRIDLNIFRRREDYLKLTGAPEWSGGNFTGTAVNTFITEGGFEDTVGTLFHEAAHQFVSLATNASGWLNEGLASFFEGCRILPNGTVEMNLPANNRLIPLVRRMENGWMSSVEDGIDKSDAAKSNPSKAPTLAIIIQNQYEWGPPWYAPTWGIVYFFYNFQDPLDGRYLYRDSFWEFVNKSGGRMGDSAVANFEEIVLGNPAPPTKGVEVHYDGDTLPRTTAEMDPIWKDWILRLRDEQIGRVEVERPWLEWARHAITRGDLDHARDHFEKGLRADPASVDLLLEFAELLAEQDDNEDRATKLVVRALQVLERAEPVDEKRVAAAEKQLSRWDSERKGLNRVQEELYATARSIVQRYLSSELYLMTMDLAWRLGTELEIPGMFELYEDALRQSGKSIQLWQLAYNEADMRGWSGAGFGVFEADGQLLRSDFTQGATGEYDFRFLTLDTVTSGDFSMQAQVLAPKGEVTFCGLVFGQKTDKVFHSVLYFPGKVDAGASAGSGFIDLVSFYGAGASKTWRHNPTVDPTRGEQSTADSWVTLRIDVTGTLVDVWIDDRFVATQDFGSRDVLRGNFGLITGPGKASYRNVRYLARPARDRGAAIARDVRLADVVEEGGSIGGSWQGMTPPFPTVKEWVQGERASWSERFGAPQLLVLFSIAQNDLIPLGDWLAHLAATHAEIGLEIVSVAEAGDHAALADYLAAHPFPGTVGVDVFPAEAGVGVVWEDYSIGMFNLPRLILLDVDGKVAWEGDPGFKIGMGWDPSAGSYLDLPLEELVAQRRLRELGPWRQGWEQVGRPALAEGRLEEALPWLEQATDFDGERFPSVGEAQSKLAALRQAIESPGVAARTLVREEAEPAMDVLIEFSKVLGTPIDPKRDKEVRALGKSEHAKDWERALDLVQPVLEKLERGREFGTVEELDERLARCEGLFPRLLRERLAAVDATDTEALVRVLGEAERLPEVWLLADYFSW